MQHCDRHIGIDYSGAKTPTSRLSGLRVYVTHLGEPQPVTTPKAISGRPWNWTRQEVAEWLINQARSGPRFIVGLDHGFSFPQSYFDRYKLTSWSQMLHDFVKHWPTHEPDTYVDFIREQDGGPRRIGSTTDFRLTETWTSSTKSVFQFDVQGSVAKSTHAGLPWLLHIRQAVDDLVHFWPFDGWTVPDQKSAIVEVYPSIFRRRYPRDSRTTDQQDAYSIARWLHEMQQRGALQRYFQPPLSESERNVAELEGWIFGIV